MIELQTKLQALQNAVEGQSDRPRDVLSCFAGDDGKTLTKLLQRDGAVGLLVECQHEYHIILGTFVYPLQTGDRNTSEVLAGLLRQFRPGSEYRENAARKVRLSTTDSYAGNVRAERINLAAKEGWDWLAYWCQLHKLATGTERVIKPTLDGIVSWMIAVGKTLEVAGEMNRLRATARKKLRDIYKIIDRPVAPGSDAAKFKDKILDQFLGSGPGVRARPGPFKM